MQRNLATKIRAKWESGLTTVWLKQDPPVPLLATRCLYWGEVHLKTEDGLLQTEDVLLKTKDGLLKTEDNRK